MESDGVEVVGHRRVTASHNGWAKVWKKGCGTRWMALLYVKKISASIFHSC